MEFNTKIALPETFKADCVAVGVFDGGALTASARRIDAITRGALRSALASGDMTGARGTSLLLRGLPGVASARVLLVKRLRLRGVAEFSNYRKFTVDTSTTYTQPPQ